MPSYTPRHCIYGNITLNWLDVLNLFWLNKNDGNIRPKPLVKKKSFEIANHVSIALGNKNHFVFPYHVMGEVHLLTARCWPEFRSG